MGTNKKIKALVKAKLKEQTRIKNLEKQNEQEQKRRNKLEKDGIKSVSLLSFDTTLKPKQYIIAQAGTLGINREFLKETQGKMRLSLQSYVGKQIGIYGVISDVKFNDDGKAIAFMIATPSIIVNNQSLVVDSHIWVFFKKMQHTKGANNHFELALGAFIELEAIIASYRTFGKIKYGIDKWIVNDSGIAYNQLLPNHALKEIHISSKTHKMIVPFATITNKNDEYTLETISKNEYLSGEEFLLNHYIKIRERISTESNKSISNGLKKKGGV